MPFPKQHSGAKAPKGGVDEPADGCCFFCGLQVDQDEQYIQGTCSKCGTRPFCFHCVADYLEKNVRSANSSSKAVEKGRNIARNRPQDLFAQNRTVQRKPQNCPRPDCSGLMVDAELIKPQKQQRAEEEEEANAPAPAAAKPPAKQPAAAKPQPKAAAPVIKRLVSAPTATLPRAASASSSALGGEDASRSGVASRAASATGDGGGSTASAAAAAALSRPGSSSSTGAEPQGLTTAAAAARKQLEQQRKAAAALKLDIAAAASRRSSAAAPASSSSSRSSTAVGGWGKVPRSASTPAAKAAGEEWPALGPGGNRQPAVRQPGQPLSSVGGYASLFGGPPPVEATASEAAQASAAFGAAPQPATPSAVQPAASLSPSYPEAGKLAGNCRAMSRAAQDALSDSDEEASGLAGSIAAALRKQQQALLLQLASGGQPWEQVQQATQQAAEQVQEVPQQQSLPEPGTGPLPASGLALPNPVQQRDAAVDRQPTLLPLPPHLLTEPQPWEQQADTASGLLPLPPHLAGKQQPWEQQGGGEAGQQQPGLLPLPPHLSATPWEQRAAAAEPLPRWQHHGDQVATATEPEYSWKQQQPTAAPYSWQQQQGQAQPYEQAAPPTQAYVPPPQVRPEGDEAEVDALLCLLGIG